MFLYGVRSRAAALVLAFFVSAFWASAQDYSATLRGADGKKLPIDMELKDIQEVGRVFVPEAAAESQANLNAVDLIDLEGNPIKAVVDRVTVIEYWSMDANKDNLYWNKMRELEREFADSDVVQFLSINYDFILTGKHHRKAVKDYVENRDAPAHLLLDRWDGFRDLFLVNGPVTYLLIDHRGQYTNLGRGDHPDTIKLFEQHLPNALEYQKMAREGQTLPR